MRRLSLNRSEPAKKSGQNIPKNPCRTTVAERMGETQAELPFIGDQVGCLKPRLGRPQRDLHDGTKLERNRKFVDSPLEEGVASEPVSEARPYRRSRG